MRLEKQWYAIYTRPRWEQKVSELLAKKKVNVYCPLNKVVKQWSDRKKVILEPLFKSYVFVNVSNQEFIQVLKTDGVLNFVHWLKKPAVINDAEIEAIKDFLTKHKAIQIEPIKVSVKDSVKIKTGPFEGEEGEIVSSNNRFVNVLLPSLGYKLTAKIELTNVGLVPVKVF